MISLKTVKYINFDEQDGKVPFAGVIFEDYFSNFKDIDEITGKPVLISGELVPNERYKKAQIIVKSDLEIKSI